MLDLSLIFLDPGLDKAKGFNILLKVDSESKKLLELLLLLLSLF